MEKINGWILTFTKSWKTYDIEGVMNLFMEDVEYWETPFIRIIGIPALKQEWGCIKKQENLSISCNIFSKYKNKYTVLWDLEYTNQQGEHKKWKGIYLIRLNAKDKCDYFLQCGEPITNNG